MSVIDEVVDSIKGESMQYVREQLKELLTSASEDTNSVIKETGQKMEEWLQARAKGELSDDELKALLYSRQQLIQQYKNTLEIQVRARLEKIALGLVDIVLQKVLGVPVSG